MLDSPGVGIKLMSQFDDNSLKDLNTVTLIRTTMTSKGSGSPDSPVRCLVQYWTSEGQLVETRDPCAISVSPELLALIIGDFDALRASSDIVTALKRRLSR